MQTQFPSSWSRIGTHARLYACVTQPAKEPDTTRLMRALILQAMLASILPAQFAPISETIDRKMTRVLWHEHGKVRQVSISFGQAEWRSAYDNFIDSRSPRHIRLGSGAWTTLQSSLDFELNKQSIRAGRWYLGVQRNEKKKWFLTLMAAEKVDRLGSPAGSTISQKPDITTPLVYSRHDKHTKKLSIDLTTIPGKPDRAQLTIAWGNHRLTGEITVTVDLSLPAGVPEFKASDPAKLITTDSGLQYEQLQAGDGNFPTATDNVKVHYSGWSTSGDLFDSSHQRGAPITLNLRQVIKGWTEGIQLMQPGAIFQFTIPPELGYGQRGAGARIPPNSTLVFRVTLIAIE